MRFDSSTTRCGRGPVAESQRMDPTHATARRIDKHKSAPDLLFREQGQLMNRKPVVCFFTLSSGNWGGASRVLYTALPSMDRSRMPPLVILPSSGPIESELDRHDLRYMVWGPLTEPGDIRTYLQAFYHTWRLYHRERIAVIHINGSNLKRPTEKQAAWVQHIPIIAHYHVVNDEPG